MVGEIKFNTKKRTYTGTDNNDLLDASTLDYIVPNVGKNKDKGLTIKGGKGNDTITGTAGNDIITGGVGTNIINYSKGDGNDVINLTKDENFTLNFTGLAENDIRFEFVNKNRDLRIYTSQTSNSEYITIKNFVKKDVTGENGQVIVKIGENTYNLKDAVLEDNTYLYNTEIEKSYTGTWLSENISAEGYIVYEDKHKEYESDDWSRKGLTIKTGGGNNSVVGSWYSDTIVGGNGDDIINGGSGNDKLTGGQGNNRFIFDSECGTDTIVDGKLGDTIQVTDVISDDLRYIRTNNNLEIYFNEDYEDENKIILQNFYASNNNIDRVITYDGEVSLQNIELDGIAGSGKVVGTDDSENIIAYGVGSTKIYSGKGDDTIEVSDYRTSRKIYFYEGDGNDTVTDSYGERYYKGHSLYDTLVFEKNTSITPSWVWTGRGKIDLTINYGDNGDSVFLPDFYLDFDHRKYIQIGNKRYRLNTFLNLPRVIEINGDNKTYQGTSGDDQIVIYGNNNTIYSGDGNDYIENYSRKINNIYPGSGNNLVTGYYGNIHFKNDNSNDIIQSRWSLLIFDDETDINNLKISKDDNFYTINYNNDNDSVKIALREIYNEGVGFLINQNFYSLANSSLYMSTTILENIGNGIDNLSYWYVGETNKNNTISFNTKYVIYDMLQTPTLSYYAKTQGVITFDGDDTIRIGYSSGTLEKNISLYGGNGNDTYDFLRLSETISQDFDTQNFVTYEIYDSQGDNDTLKLYNAVIGNNPNISVFVNINENGDYDNNLYIRNLSSSHVYDSYHSISSNYYTTLCVKDYFTTNGKIENITLPDNSLYLDTSSFSFDEIKSEVAGWLTDNGYTDVIDAIQTNNSNLQTLINANYFNDLEWKTVET